MNRSCELQVALVSRDSQVVDLMTSCLRNMGIQSNVHDETASAIQAMRSQKIDGFVVDRELDPELSVLSSMRTAPSSQRAIGFAIVPRLDASGGNYRLADFVLDKPLLQARVNQTLRAAYGIMLKERLRYSRHALRTQATLVDSMNRTFLAVTTNISQTGIALQSAAPLIAGEAVQLQFSLPSTQNKMNCRGQIIWKDEQGKAGLAFTEIHASDRERLNCWIESEFVGNDPRSGQRPGSVAPAGVASSA